MLAAPLVCILLVLAPVVPAAAHALQPGYLELQMIGTDTWRVFWRKPAVGRGYRNGSMN